MARTEIISSGPIDLELGRAIFQIAERTQKIQDSLEALVMLQTQLKVIERQLDAIVVLASRTFSATLDPKAKELAEKEGKAMSEALAKEMEEKMESILSARGGDHPPTEEEMARAEREFS